MSWSTTSDVLRFLAEAGGFLRARPVEHTTLLTEAAYLEARPANPDQAFGWWRDAAGVVGGAFLRAPRHAPVLSPMPTEAVESLPEVLGGAQAVEVEAGMAETVAATWKRGRGVELAERSRITLYRLEALVPHIVPGGRARTAVPSDRETLLRWYQRMLEKYPEDPSESEYMVDDPIAFGGITMWEVDGEPVAMAGRSRAVAGMVRLGAVHAVGDDESLAGAAFAQACRAASEIAEHVLVFAPTGDADAARKYGALGFRPVLERVMLGVRASSGDETPHPVADDGPHDSRQAQADLRHLTG